MKIPWHVPPSERNMTNMGGPDASLIQFLLKSQRAKDGFADSTDQWIEELRKWLREGRWAEVKRAAEGAVQEMGGLADELCNDAPEEARALQVQRDKFQQLLRFEILAS